MVGGRGSLNGILFFNDGKVEKLLVAGSCSSAISGGVLFNTLHGAFPVITYSPYKIIVSLPVKPRGEVAFWHNK